MGMVNRLMTYEKHQEVGSQVQVEDYAFLVKRIAHHLIARMPSSVQLDDLIQAGMVGLIEASQKYDGSRGASFETYAGIRIRGAMVDEMRRGDWVPRSVHRNARRIMEAMSAVEARTGRDAADHEVAEEMGVTLEEYHAMASDSASGRLFSFEEAQEKDDGDLSHSHVSEVLQNPSENIQRQAMAGALAGAIDALPERERLVLSLYYDDELNLKEIGLVLGVSESRVSQILSQAAMRLKKKMSDWRGA